MADVLRPREDGAGAVELRESGVGGADELDRRQGHDYLTVLADLKAKVDFSLPSP